MKRAAVIILNWNGESLLKRFLPSVVDNTNSELADVIVADNGSSDGSLALLANEFPMVKVLRFKENYGFAQGYNLALEQTRYPLTVLLNSDVSVPSGWLEPLVVAMERHAELGACQPKLLSVNAPGQFEYAGACGGYLDRNGYPYCKGRIFGTVEDDSGQYDSYSDDLHWATGACLMVRTEEYLRLGGLDASFFAHMEEIDLCWRMRLAGWKIGYVPASRVYHLGGGSLPAENPRKTYLNFRNNLLMMRKNLPKGERRWALLRRQLLDGLAGMRFLAMGDFKNLGAVIRAHRDYRRMSNEQKMSDAEDNLLRGGVNILWEYYLMGRKTYKNIHKM